MRFIKEEAPNNGPKRYFAAVTKTLGKLGDWFPDGKVFDYDAIPVKELIQYADETVVVRTGGEDESAIIDRTVDEDEKKPLKAVQTAESPRTAAELLLFAKDVLKYPDDKTVVARLAEKGHKGFKATQLNDYIAALEPDPVQAPEAQ
jgi:hypothetical protein